MPKPVRPPLTETHPCAQCLSGRTIGKRRLCPKCVKANKDASNAEYTANRAVVLELKRAVEEFGRRLAEVEAQLPRRQRIRGICK